MQFLMLLLLAIPIAALPVEHATRDIDSVESADLLGDTLREAEENTYPRRDTSETHHYSFTNDLDIPVDRRGDISVDDGVVPVSKQQFDTNRLNNKFENWK
ncbi:hypothetical protein QQS21_008128 [Conoideocrella luteorostrata]|uniref:Uncharacterized protein n=1 Tax=Conoideocrella luteorostrata TaxID=1105319 RepID=A0AAJ0CJM2_9HYPO|nr:hypothetical protein QQS21_008128 [Conoideocrella luteorostrata]